MTMIYSINLAKDVIKSNKIKLKFFKVVNFITMFVGLIILTFAGFTVYKKFAIGGLEREITGLINTIDNKRSAEVLQMENLWEEYNFKLLAVSEQLSNSTKYGLILKEFANMLPPEAVAVSISVSGDNLEATLNVPQDIMTELKSFYDYTDILKKSFEKSFFINPGSIKIISWITEIDKKKRGFETIDVQMVLSSRKRI